MNHVNDPAANKFPNISLDRFCKRGYAVPDRGKIRGKGSQSLLNRRAQPPMLDSSGFFAPASITLPNLGGLHGGPSGPPELLTGIVVHAARSFLGASLQGAAL